MFTKFMLIGMMILILISCDDQTGSISSVEDLQKRVNTLNTLTNDVESKRTELYALIRNFNNQLPEDQCFDIARIDTSIGTSERELLRTMFKEEKDITYNGLLKTIIEKNNDISEINIQIAKLQSQLPIPYIVKRGDTHYEIVIDYLLKQQGLSKKEAHNLAFCTAMIDDILPGNQIWLMYNNGAVGTYVTQGTAKMNPMKFQMLSKKRLIEKSKMISSVQSSSTYLTTNK